MGWAQLVEATYPFRPQQRMEKRALICIFFCQFSGFWMEIWFMTRSAEAVVESRGGITWSYVVFSFYHLTSLCFLFLNGGTCKDIKHLKAYWDITFLKYWSWFATTQALLYWVKHKPQSRLDLFTSSQTPTHTVSRWTSLPFTHTLKLFTLSIHLPGQTHTLQLLLHVSALRKLSPFVETFSTSPLTENCRPFTSLFHILAAAVPMSFTAVTIALADGQRCAARPQCKESRHYPISWEGPGGYMLLIYRRANTPCDWPTGLCFKGRGEIYQARLEWHIERRVNICSVERSEWKNPRAVIYAVIYHSSVTVSACLELILWLDAGI